MDLRADRGSGRVQALNETRAGKSAIPPVPQRRTRVATSGVKDMQAADLDGTMRITQAGQQRDPQQVLT
jgi:hypothetical protein